MPLWIELLLAGIVFIGVITVGKAIITGLAMGRRSSHPWRNNPVHRHPRKRRKFLPQARKPAGVLSFEQYGASWFENQLCRGLPSDPQPAWTHWLLSSGTLPR